MATAPILLVAGCGDEPADPGTAELPDNLCDVVAPAVPNDWALDELNHTTQDQAQICTLGTEETQLVTSFSAVEQADVEAAFGEACGQYATEPADAGR